MKQLIFNALDRFGVELNRSSTLKRFLASHPIDLVIDAGANLGQFGQSIRRKAYSGPIWSFEPVRYIYEALQQRVARDPYWTISHCALGDSSGELEINVPSNHQLSSFLQPGPLLEAYNSTTHELRREKVQVQRLDDVLANCGASNIFLKIDVQGFERQVLEGARESLVRTHALYIELPIDHLYQGGWDFPEAISYLDSIGFTPAQFRMVSPMPNDRSCAVEFDVLLRRKSA